MDTTQHRVSPDTAVDMRDWATGAPKDVLSKKDARGAMEELNARFGALQDLLFAQAEHKVLVVLQGIDTAGKDGTIKHVFEPVNPAAVNVVTFTQPTQRELDHDFLWRVHPHVPYGGQITIFNRSHYEDVLIVRVRGLVPEERWRRRYRHIREFERLLTDEGTTILKFFLHISKDEQKRRLEARLQDPTKQWKFHIADLDERKKWDEYQEAFAEAISETSTLAAPWYVVPSDNKWYRDYVISNVLIETLESLDLRYPDVEPGLDKIEVE